MNTRFQRGIVAAALFAAGALSIVTASAAIDPPTRRAGIWESTFQEGDGPKKLADKRCTSPEWEARIAAATAKFTAESCSKNELRKVGATWVSDSVCTLFGKTITGHSVTSGDLQTTIRIETEQRESDGTVTRTTTEGRWLGPCGPNDKPGSAVKR
jgi:hypothetical protein